MFIYEHYRYWCRGKTVLYFPHAYRSEPAVCSRLAEGLKKAQDSGRKEQPKRSKNDPGKTND